MRAAHRSLQDFATADFADMLPHLTPTRRAILRTLYDPEAPSIALREEILTELPEDGDEDALETEMEVLGAWKLVTEAGSTTSRTEDGGHTTRRRFILTGRGDELMDEYGDALDEHAVALAERTADEWLSYPVPTEHKVVELANEVADLRAQLDGQNAAAADD